MFDFKKNSYKEMKLSLWVNCNSDSAVCWDFEVSFVTFLNMKCEERTVNRLNPPQGKVSVGQTISIYYSVIRNSRWACDIVAKNSCFIFILNLS